VLLRPNDPTEQLGTTNTQQLDPTDLARYVAGQAMIVTSLPVAQEAAKRLPKDEQPRAANVRDLLKDVSVQQSDLSNVIGISAHGSSAARARNLADAFAQAYIANRKAFDVGRLQDAVSALTIKIAAAQATIDTLTRAGAASPQASATQQAALTAATTQQTDLITQQQNLQVEIGLKHGEAEIVSPAELPTGPSSPRPKRDVLIGFFLGLILGVALGLVREQLDSRISSTEEAEQLTALPLLGQIPVDAASRGNEAHHIIRDHSTSAAAEAVRALRTAILLGHERSVGHPSSVPLIVVTSPGPGEGKTLVAANLAAAFAEAGQKTLLVSADLRNPRVESMFGFARRGPGLGDYALGTIAVASAMVATDVRGLFLLRAGAAVSNPVGIFTSERFDYLLADVSRKVDVIVFDTPPVLAVTDATVIAARADEVLLVVAENETSRNSVQRARSILDSAGVGNALGLVVNKVPLASSSFDSYYRPVVR
jgi:capsular exopolysaccharide synthesis family protein